MSNKYHLISDFNIEPLKGCIINFDNEALITTAPYGQVVQEIYNNNLDKNSQVVIWSLPYSVIPTFADAMKFKTINEKVCLKEVKKYSEAIINLSKRQKYVFLSSWVLEKNISNYGILDWRPNIGIANMLAKMNIYIADLLGKYENIYILDSQYWHYNVDKVIPKIWYATKVPFSSKVFQLAAESICSASSALNGFNRKLIILDLDNTLWGGVVGDLGIEGINLGGHNFIGEAFKEFQEILLSLSNRGIQLAIVSKNDESVGLDVIDNHNEMLLKRKNFSCWRINWEDKASNIKSLLKELNLGASSAIFIDDSPVERDWVRISLPEVLVPDWPSDPTHYVTALSKLNCFEVSSLSKEDRYRTKMYVTDRERREIKENAESIEDWLLSLKTKAKIHLLDKNNINRVSQLFNKTNQLNLQTRRLSQDEILSWMNNKKNNKRMYIIEVKDRLGDLGLVGIVSLELVNSKINIVDFILSCRVMGRKIEQLMIWLALNYAKKVKAKKLVAHLIPTKKNRPTHDILINSILEKIDDNIFEVSSEVKMDSPKEIYIENTLIK
jgi:FkbH-like protein